MSVFLFCDTHFQVPMRYATSCFLVFPTAKRLMVMLGLALLASTASAGVNFGTDVAVSVRFLPDGTLFIQSNTDLDGDINVDTSSFKPFKLEDLFADIASSLLFADEDVIQAVEDAFSKIEAAAGEGTPFGVFAQNATFENVQEAIELNTALTAVANADPFVGIEGTFSNNGSAPLNIDLNFDLGIFPIDISTLLVLDTQLTAKLTSVSDDPTPTDVLVFHTLSASPTPEDPQIRDTFNAEAAFDSVSDLVPGIATTDETDSVVFSPQALIGLPGNTGGIFGMSSFMAIDELQPGDELTVRFAFSLGTEDGAVPPMPAEAIIAGLDGGFFTSVPEPTTCVLLLISVHTLLGRHRLASTAR